MCQPRFEKLRRDFLLRFGVMGTVMAAVVVVWTMVLLYSFSARRI